MSVMGNFLGSDRGQNGTGPTLLSSISFNLTGQVCVLGYILIALALVVFVQCKNVYPQLLLARLLFSSGGAAASTMVTAVLPAMSIAAESDYDPTGSRSLPREQSIDGSASSADNGHEDGSTHAPSVSVSSELTITPALYQSSSAHGASTRGLGSSATIDPPAASSKIAGYVGMFAGCGALLALVIFLPFPERLQKHGSSPEMALKLSYYGVAGAAFLVSLWCLVGLRGLHEESVTTVSMFNLSKADQFTSNDNDRASLRHLWKSFHASIVLGFKHADIGLGYVGGFVARSSSVGISLFVPLLVNALFRSSGLCHDEDVGGLPDLKKKCAQAYILAAELTGVSQLVALLSAPIFGYVSARLGRRQGPLMFASSAGVIGYTLIATRFEVDRDHQHGSAEAFVYMCLIGISQIGAIVCSLGILSGGVLRQQENAIRPYISAVGEQSDANDQEGQRILSEDTPLISTAREDGPKDLSSLKGSIAGIYSLYGGAGILILTKLGGLLFDQVSFGAPFYIMAIFNAILFLTCLLLTSRSFFQTRVH